MRRFLVFAPLALIVLAGCGGSTPASTVPPPPPAPAPPPPPSPVVVAAVTVTGGGTPLVAPQTTQLSATPRDASGNALTGRTVTWASANGAVATVGTTGLVAAVAPGIVTITATSEGVNGTAVITVTPATVAVATVTVTAPSTVLNVGDAVQFTAVTKDAQGNVLAGRAVTWLSTTPATATVSATGLVTAVVAGSTTIRATSEGVSMDVPIAVSNATPTLIESHIVVQQGMAIALASTVLQSQLIVLLEMATTTPVAGCTAYSGGSYQLVSATTALPAKIGVYFDAACTRPYMIETVTQYTSTTFFSITATAVYTGSTGTTLGTMSFQERTDTDPAGDLIVSGLGTFTPADGSPSSSLGLNCLIDINGDGSHTPCQGGIVQNFATLATTLGSVSSLNLDLSDPTGTGSMTFTGPSVLTSGPLNSLTLTAPSTTAMVVQGGSAYGATAVMGGAGNFSLFPPTPTGWSVADAAHDQLFTISVVDNVARNLTGTVKRISTGATLVTFAVDQSGTGTITYSDGTTAKVTSWLVEK